MFCRFCGNKISSNDKYCNRCGHIVDSVNSTHAESSQSDISEDSLIQNNVSSIFYSELGYYNQSETNKTALNSNPLTSRSTNRLRIVSIIASVLAVIAFLVLFFEMAPGINRIKTATYIFGVVIVVGFFVTFLIINRKNTNPKICIIAIAASLALVLTLFGLRITYEVKKDRVLLDSNSDLMYIQLDTKTVLRPVRSASGKTYHTTVLIDGRAYEDGDIYIAKAGKDITLEIRCAYMINGKQGKEGVHTIDHTAFRKGFVKTKSPNVTIRFDDDLRAVVTLNFHRVCGFWEAIFY